MNQGTDACLPRPHWSSYALSDPPKVLYRVHYDFAGTILTKGHGLDSFDTDVISKYTNPNCYERLKRHLNWTKDPNCNVRSHMISTFGSKAHAENWAKQWRAKRPGGDYFICSINVGPDSCFYDCYRIFRASELASVLNIPLHPSMKTDVLRDEYLVFRNVHYLDVKIENWTDGRYMFLQESDNCNKRVLELNKETLIRPEDHDDDDDDDDDDEM